MAPLRGTFWVLLLYDVCESIDLAKLRTLIQAAPPGRKPPLQHAAPGYVRFERPPVEELLDPVELEAGELFAGRIKYFDYGVVSIELGTHFETDWDGLIARSSGWMGMPELEGRVQALARAKIARLQAVLAKPYDEWLSEDYYVIRLNPLLDGTGQVVTARQLLDDHGAQIAQVIRGETVPLSPGEQSEALRSSLSYYADDLLVAGWLAALIYDNGAGTATAVQLLEYANTQLLEFRHYDQVLTRVLGEVYEKLEGGGGVFHRWRLAREAERLNRIRLDVTELAERFDNAIKFLSDMFDARAYRMASEKVGVSDYRRQVEEKLQAAGELYEFLSNQFHQARAFVLELMVVAILVIELIYLFRGRG